MRKLILTGLVAAFGIAGICAAQAQTVDEAIAARRAGMQLQAAVAGASKRAIDAGADVKPLKGAADAVANWAKALPGLLVAGSDKGDTNAMAEAISDKAGFMKAAMTLNAAALKLSVAADANDKTAFAAAFGEVGAACGGCHRAYRKK